ncbi:cache domain-containing protein [Methanosarcina sp. UBA411]|uniref:cache domain-containing protein n=1 Tax=Methanosarcina sp. UBA411 TaxID=1915589 RepID=UPI0025E970A1|nr:hypothetical protein [Methanosarcina sp. UBA411]
MQAEEKNEIFEPAVSKPAPDPFILEKGESKLAGEIKNIESKVKATVRLIEAQGKELFPSFREKGSPWYQDSFCIFVWTEDGVQIVCPSKRSCEGKDMKGLVDADGKPIGELFIETPLARKERAGLNITGRREIIPRHSASAPSSKRLLTEEKLTL